MRQKRVKPPGDESELSPVPARTEHGDGAVESARDIIRIEKNLVALGFFTPTSKGKTGKLKVTRVKTLQITREGTDGQPVLTSVRIVPGGVYGLPGTGDLDRWLAFMKHVNNIRDERGVVVNPVAFTSYELLSHLGVRLDGRDKYDSVSEWLDRMYATTIELSATKGKAGQREGAKQSLRVFADRVSKDRELPGGGIADKNYVWLSDWQLESINRGRPIPIDFETYRRLRRPIAKTLYPLLQRWLYASRGAGVFVKQYAMLCQILGIKEWRYERDIFDSLNPSLAEFQDCGYLAGWGLERKRRQDGFNIVLKHGKKFYADLEALGLKEETRAALPAALDEAEAWLVSELVERGVAERKAVELVKVRRPGQHVEDNIEYYDYIIHKKGVGSFDNPPGLLIHFVTNNVRPVGFEPSRLRRRREEVERQAWDALAAEQELRDENWIPPDIEGGEAERAPSPYDLYLLRRDYDEYVRGEIRAYVERIPRERYAALIEEMREKWRGEQPHAAQVFSEQITMGILEGMLETHVTPEVPVLSYDEFAARREN